MRMIVTEWDYPRTEFLRAVSFLLRAPCSVLPAQPLLLSISRIIFINIIRIGCRVR